MQTPRPSGSPDDPDREQVLASLADYVETSLNAIGHSLTDEPTVEVYTRTLGLVEHMLGGATEQGIVSEEQRRELAVLLAGLVEAPHRL